MTETLGQHVRRVRDALRMTQKDVGQRMRPVRDKSYIGHIERDRAKRPSYPLLVELAEALGEEVDDLLAATGLREKYQAEAQTPPQSPGSQRVEAYVRTVLSDLSDDKADTVMLMLEGLAGEDAPGRSGRRTSQDAPPDEPPTP